MSTTLSNTESFLCGCLLLIQKPLVNLIFESVGDDESVFFFGFSLEFWDFCDMEESKTNDVDVIKRSMSDEAFDEAVKLTRSALESQEVDKDVAEHIKTQMEKKFHGSWYVFFPIRFPFESLVFIQCSSHPFYYSSSIHLLKKISSNSPFPITFVQALYRRKKFRLFGGVRSDGDVRIQDLKQKRISVSKSEN